MGSEPRDESTDDNRTRSRYLQVLPQFLRAHYSRKFFVAFFLVVLVIGTVGGVNYVQIQETVSDEASTDLRAQATARALLQSQWITEMESQARLVSGTVEPNVLSLREAHEQATADVVAIHYVDTRQGTVVASTERRKSGAQLSEIDAEWTHTLENIDLLRSLPSSVWVTNASYERDGLPVVAFVSPTPDGRSAAILVSSNERLVRQFDTSSTVKTAIYTDTGQSLFGAPTESLQAHTDVLSRVSRTGNTSLVDKEDHLVVYVPIKGTEWVAVSRAPKSELYQASDAVGRNVIYIITASILLLVGIGVVLGRHTIVPLNRLRQRTRQLAENDFDVNLETTRSDEIGQLYNAFASMRDALQEQIQETRAAKEEVEAQRDNLQRATTRLQLALKETDTGVWEWDPDTDQVTWDEASERLYGYEPGAFPGTLSAVSDRVVSEDWESVETDFETAIETGEEFRAEFRIRLPDGDRRWIQTRGVRRDDGDHERLLGIQTDITDQKEREQELEETKETLEQSNEKLEQFASVVSHDLRNPLNAAKLRFDLLREDAPEEHAQSVERNLDRMEAMIDDLLTLARVGQTVETTESIVLSDVVEHAWANIDAGECKLTQSIPTDTTLQADRDRLLRVFENLFRNAIEHNQEPVTIHVGLLEESDTMTDHDSVSGFFVEDDGSGIPADTRSEVLEHGYTTNDDGTGFGLSIVADIVQAHSWDIQVTAADTGGARFEIDTTASQKL
jgi:PAS domain S-box-containing protein